MATRAKANPGRFTGVNAANYLPYGHKKTGNVQAQGCKVYRLSRKKSDKKNAVFEVDLRLTDFYGPVV